MKKHNFLSVILSLIFFSSCSHDIDPTFSESRFTKLETTLENDSSFESDIIVPLEGDRDTLRRPRLRSLEYTDQYEIDQLNLIPFYLKVKGNTSNRQFVTTIRKGSELTMEAYRGNESQQFYIRILPASSGIPYLIYSQNTKTPIAVGSYSKVPNQKILYARNDEKISFGVSWDFIRGSYSPNSFVIENQDFPESGGTSWFDIYYNVITVNEGKISFSKYSQSPRQEFEIIPAEKFILENVTFNTDAGTILSRQPQNIYKEGYSNTGPIQQSYTFEINKSYIRSSSFNQKTSYNISTKSTTTFGIPLIAKEKLDLSTSVGQDFTFGETQSKTIAVKRSYPVTVPPNYRADLSLVFFKYNMNVDYVATARGETSGRKIEIKGVWNGVDVEETDASLTLTSLNGGAQKTIRITRKMLESKQIIQL